MLASPSPSAPADYVRGYCIEVAERAALYARHVADYCSIGDDRGAARSLRLLATVAVAGAECAPLLLQASEAEARLVEFGKALARDKERPPVEANPGKVGSGAEPRPSPPEEPRERPGASAE